MATLHLLQSDTRRVGCPSSPLARSTAWQPNPRRGGSGCGSSIRDSSTNFQVVDQGFWLHATTEASTIFGLQASVEQWPAAHARARWRRAQGRKGQAAFATALRLCSFSTVPEQNYCCSAPLLQATSSPGSATTSLTLMTAGAGCYCAFNFQAFIIRHMSNCQLKIPDALCIVLEYTEY